MFGLGLLQQVFRSEINQWRVVLVQRVHGHAVGGCAGRLGQALAKGVVRLIGNADPIDSAKHDRLRLTKQHHSPATQRHRVQPHHRVVSHHVAKRRRGIDVERGHAQWHNLGTGHPHCARKQKSQRNPNDTSEN